MQDQQANKDIIIADNGSGYFKCGYAGDSFPRWTIPSIVGTPELRAGAHGEGVLKERMVGDEAAAMRAMLDIKYPLADGKVRDWDLLEELWEYTFMEKYRLPKHDCSGKRILCTETAMNPKKDREAFGEMVFEKFGFEGCVFKVQAILSLASEGRNEGLVFDSGDGAS